MHQSEKRTSHELVLNQYTKDLLIRNTVGFIDIVNEFKKYNLNCSKGIILYGPPGCGKTSIANWIAELMEEKDWDVYRDCKITGKLPEDKDKVLCIFDDIDVDALNRNRSPDKASALIRFLDGVYKGRSRLCIFTTNEDSLDVEDALRRPGRIDTVIEVGLPNDEARVAYYNSIADHIRQSVTLEDWLKFTEKNSFADMARVYQELLSQKLLRNETPNIEEAITYLKELMHADIVGPRHKKMGFKI
jgi:SpoVK/Ycf46/Vps4 family AAA+-type ATPase